MPHFGFAKCVDQFKIGRPKFKKFIVSSGQNLLDKKNTWFVNKYDGSICYGVETNGDLINTKGIHITKYSVYIAHFDQYGRMTKPCLYCTSYAYGIR